MVLQAQFGKRRDMACRWANRQAKKKLDLNQA